MVYSPWGGARRSLVVEITDQLKTIKTIEWLASFSPKIDFFLIFHVGSFGQFGNNNNAKLEICMVALLIQITKDFKISENL